MARSAGETDFNEPGMARYVSKHILDTTGPLIRASWNSGLGAVPLGFTTYAPNAIERAHRLTKGLLDKGYQHRDIAQLITDVAQALQSRIQAGAYADLRQEIPTPPACFIKWQQKKLSGHSDTNANHEEETARPQRLDLASILNHYRAYGAARTFMSKACRLTLASGDEVVVAYVMPKYKLNLAVERPQDMEAQPRSCFQPGVLRFLCHRV